MTNPILAALQSQGQNQRQTAQPQTTQSKAALMNNPVKLISEFAKFKKALTGDPYETLDGLLKSGQMTNEELAELKDEAESIMYLFK